MHLRQILTTAVFLLITLISNEQDSSSIIRETVSTSDGNPAGYGSILISGTGKGTVLEKEGQYIFKNIPPGTYSITANFAGFVSQITTIKVEAG